MKNNRNRIILWGFFIITFFLAGCAGQLKKPLKVCPGSESIEEAIAILNENSQNFTPIKANGWLKYRSPKESEGFPISLWINPPDEIYLQGNKALDPRAIIAGANKNSFWFAVKPGESVLIVGDWSMGYCFEDVLVSPKILLEALGMIDIQTKQDCLLSNEGPFDVLTIMDSNGNTIKKVYIYNCENTVYQIKYFNKVNKETASIKLENYKQIEDGFAVPTLIKIVKNSSSSQKKSVNLDIEIRTAKPVELSDKQKEVIFKQPDKSLYKRFLRFNSDCELIEQ